MKKVLQECWKQKLDMENCFPNEIAQWIEYNSVLAGGVPETYISWPLLVCAAYCSRHARVEIYAPRKSGNDTDPIPNRKKNVVMYKQPLILYALVVGRSGN